MKFILNLAMLFSVVVTHAQAFKVGVITDFEQSPNLIIIIDQMIHEINQTTGASQKITLEATSFGISDLESAQTSYGELEGQVDLIIAVGSITAKGLSLMSNLATPVIALGIIDPGLQEIPYLNGTSGKSNFTYVWQTLDLDKELEAFYKMHHFKSVVVFVDEKAASTVSEQKARNLLDSLSEKLNAELSVIPVGADLEQVIDQIPAKTDAAYFTVLLSQPESKIQLLINQLNERKIPTFTGSSRLIHNGVLGSMAHENDLEQVIRKLAIMIDGITSGSNLSSMPVILETKESLYINIATARKIQLSIPFEVLFTATIVGSDDSEIRTYSFEEIAEKALVANRNIQISYRDVELSHVRVKSTRSSILPSIESDLTASQINEERANAAFNTPEKALTAGLTFTQLIYSEKAIASIKISRYLEQAQKHNTEAEVLRVLFDTYVAYINVLSAKTNVQIQHENLSNTRKNKELAAIRVNLGATSNTDLYRWESELAIANQSVIEAQTTLLAAKLQLNTLLANTLESEYEVADVSLEDDLFKTFHHGPVSELVRTPKTLRVVSDFLVAESQRQNPNKKALIENIHAANRQLEQNQRLLYTPAIALQAKTSQILARGGAGSTLDAQAMALGMTELQDNAWLVGVSLSLPIFDGFSRKAAIQQSKVRLDQLDHSQTLLDQNLELGVRAGVLNLLSASTNIRYSKSASENALENFELVQENYKQGQVTITQLIDAQQTALEARLGAAFSIYEYIQSHLQLQLNVGSFVMLMPEDQLLDFNNRLQQYLDNQN